MGKLVLKSQHRLLIDDSTSEKSLQRVMNGELADLSLQDPPYNVAYEGQDGMKIQNDSMGDEAFLEFLTKTFKVMMDSMKPGATFYIAHADSEGFNFRYAVKLAGMRVRQCLIWLKSSLVMGRQDYQWIHEPILTGWKEGAGHSWYSDRKQTTVLKFDKPKNNNLHPTMKPVALWEYFLTNSSKSGDIVLDQFMGSGTTIIACEHLGRRGFGLELEPKYAQAILQRYQEFSGKIAIREDGVSFDAVCAG